jgi:hypothetical protein
MLAGTVYNLTATVNVLESLDFNKNAPLRLFEGGANDARGMLTLRAKGAALFLEDVHIIDDNILEVSDFHLVNSEEIADGVIESNYALGVRFHGRLEPGIHRARIACRLSSGEQRESSLRLEVAPALTVSPTQLLLSPTLNEVHLANDDSQSQIKHVTISSKDQKFAILSISLQHSKRALIVSDAHLVPKFSHVIEIDTRSIVFGASNMETLVIRSTHAKYNVVHVKIFKPT